MIILDPQPGQADSLVCILLCCPFRTRVLSILAEDPRDVYVRVDPARQHRQAAQVIIHPPLDIRVHRNDLRALDRNAHVFK